MPLICAMIRGRTRFEFNEFKGQRHLPLMMNLLYLLLQLSSYIFCAEYESLVTDLISTLWQVRVPYFMSSLSYFHLDFRCWRIIVRLLVVNCNQSCYKLSYSHTGTCTHYPDQLTAWCVNMSWPSKWVCNLHLHYLTCVFFLGFDQRL